MHWGDTQSFFQVGLALNLAYYSFRGVWSPVSDRHADLIRGIDEDAERVRARLSGRLRDETLTVRERHRGEEWLARTDINGLGASARVYRSAVAELFSKVEKPLGNICLVDAIICFSLLIYSTLHYEHKLPAGWLWIIMAVTILPIIFIFSANLFALREINLELRRLNESRKRRESWWNEFIKEFPKNIQDSLIFKETN